ncbi:MAG TPA: response regulator [Acetobacteraceae bacterium]
MEPEQGSARFHVLVVEDEEVLAKTYGDVLCRAGFSISIAPDFQRALEVLEADRPVDLLLTDIVMPSGVNGIALSRMARMRQRGVKVIYITGHDIPGAETLALGPILRKPIDQAVLIAEVTRTLATEQ